MYAVKGMGFQLFLGVESSLLVGRSGNRRWFVMTCEVECRPVEGEDG